MVKESWAKDMNNTNFECSLNDTYDLRKLILENPELPLLVFCGEDALCQEFAYSQADVHRCSIQSLTLYADDMWLDEDEYTDRLRDDLCDDYADLSDEEYDRMIEQKVAETEFVKAIVMYVG